MRANWHRRRFPADVCSSVRTTRFSRLGNNRMKALLSIALLLVSVESAMAQDWPQWRGANRDGHVAAFREPSSWPDRLTSKWKVDVGIGYATPLLVGNRLYLFTRQNEKIGRAHV